MNKKNTQTVVICIIAVCFIAAVTAILLKNSLPYINLSEIEKIEVWTYPSFSYELTEDEIYVFSDIYYDSEYLGKRDGGTTPSHGVIIYYKNGESLSIHDAQSTVFELQYSDRRDDGVKTHKIDSPALLDFIKQLEKNHGEK